MGFLGKELHFLGGELRGAFEGVSIPLVIRSSKKAGSLNGGNITVGFELVALGWFLSLFFRIFLRADLSFWAF